MDQFSGSRPLSQAIRSGAGSRDFFGTAYGQAGENFEGFKLGDANVQLDDTLLLIEPDAAAQYEEAHRSPVVTPPTTGETTGTPGTVTTGTPPVGPQPPTMGSSPHKARLFHGTADVPPATAKMRMVQLADEILGLLCSDPNASVKVTVEISAEFPEGVSDQLKRSVTENSNSLGLKTKVWE